MNGNNKAMVKHEFIAGFRTGLNIIARTGSTDIERSLTCSGSVGSFPLEPVSVDLGYGPRSPRENKP